jgi:anti-anti-sigma regulatory factor
MRASGVINDVRALRLHDHVCWGYRDPGDFLAAAQGFLAEGLTLGHRVCFVASDPGDTGPWLAMHGFRQALSSGAATILDSKDVYPSSGFVEPSTQVATYKAATDAAIAAGFTGLRVAADVTTLVRTPESLDAVARYEHMVDQYMVTQGYSAMCGYSLVELAENDFAQIACMHPAVNVDLAPFRMHAGENADLVLSGELDITTVELLAGTLERLGPSSNVASLTLDAAELRFADHRSLIALSEFGSRIGAAIVFRAPPPQIGRLLDILDLDNMRLEQVG